MVQMSPGAFTSQGNESIEQRAESPDVYQRANQLPMGRFGPAVYR